MNPMMNDSLLLYWMPCVASHIHSSKEGSVLNMKSLLQGLLAIVLPGHKITSLQVG